MESTTEIDQLKAKATDNPVLYTATGWVAGTYQSRQSFIRGVSYTRRSKRQNCFGATKSTQTQASWLCGTARLFLSLRGGWFIHPLTPRGF